MILYYYLSYIDPSLVYALLYLALELVSYFILLKPLYYLSTYL